MSFSEVLQAVANCVAAAELPLGTPGTLILGPEDAGLSQPCCDNGGLMRVETLEVTPVDDEGTVYGRQCDTTFLLLAKLTILRCWPTIKANGGAPNPVEVTSTGTALVDDAYAALAAVLCCDRVRSTRRVTFIAPDGGCAGYEIEFYSDVEICC